MDVSAVKFRCNDLGMGKGNLFYRVYVFYRDGFRSMTLGRTLWALILLKLFIMFAVLRLFFFPDLLGRFDTDEERNDFVLEQLTTKP